MIELGLSIERVEVEDAGAIRVKIQTAAIARERRTAVDGTIVREVLILAGGDVDQAQIT